MDEKFDKYLAELVEWNKKFNLTAVDEPEEIKVRHFEDSLSILSAIGLSKEKVIDIGTGAGFPGIPLKIARPGIKLTLLDSTRKKTEFLKNVVEKLGLEDVEVVWGRAEEISKKKDCFESYDIVLCRAVGKIPLLLEYSIPFLKKDGLLICQKQEKVEDEIKESKRFFKKFGAEVKEIKKVKVGDVLRSIVIIKRV